jgi:hypothetical protein
MNALSMNEVFSFEFMNKKDRKSFGENGLLFEIFQQEQLL